jgi:Tol biopolymer transport system component
MGLDRELQETMRRHAADVRPSDDAWEDIERRISDARRPPGARRTPRGVVIAFALGLALLALLFVVRSFSPEGESRQPAGQPNGGFVALEAVRMPAEPGEHITPTIVLIQPDGTGYRELTDDGATYSAPAWSPDGTRIAADRVIERDGGLRESVVVMNAEGTGMREIYAPGLRIPTSVLQLAWSPDGRSIAFIRANHAASSLESEVPQDVYLMNADGSNVHQITAGFQVSSISWSPDGERIAFTKQSALNGGHSASDIYAIRVDGSDEVRLTDDGASMDPAWSPDGRTIAFVHARSAERFQQRDVYRMDASGVGLTRLTSAPGVEADPAWSADGSTIVFVAYPPGDGCSLKTIARDGSTEATIATKGSLGGMCPGDPVWQPVRPSSEEVREPSTSSTPVVDGATSTHASADCVRPDTADDWERYVVPWTTSLLVEVGTPDGRPLTRSQIIDMGSALELRPAESSAGAMYVHAGPRDPQHRPYPGRREPIGRFEGVPIYAEEHARVRVFQALGPDLWLTLYIYPDRNQGRPPLHLSEAALRDWFVNALTRAQKDPLPPPCG